MDKPATIQDYERLLSEKDVKIQSLQDELQELKRLIFGRKSERFVPPQQVPAEQLDLFIEHPHAGTQEKTVQQAVPGHGRSKGQPRREKLPSDKLPVVEVVLEMPPELVEGWTKIGEDITEELDFVPGKFRIIRYIRPRYARPAAEQQQGPEAPNILIAPLPTRAIEKGIPSAGLLAHILISKFLDHLPYYRQVKMFERIGVKIPPSTINGWVARCVSLLEVLYGRHKLRVMEKNYLMADETKIQVLDDAKKGKSHTGYFWVYYDPGGKQGLFVYDPGRGGKYPREHLKNFRGWLQTDGYSVYEAFENTVLERQLAACMAHVRRKFEHALDNDAERAGHVLKLIQQLYAVERTAREQDLDAPQRLALRQQHARPVMQELQAWLVANKDQVLPKSKIGQAVQYALNRWKYAKRYLDDGQLEIDNNLVENAIRPVALGRKNYLFAGSHEGAKWAAVLYSLISSAANCGHNPYEYLRDVLQRLPDQPLSCLDELLPPNWVPVKGIDDGG